MSQLTNFTRLFRNVPPTAAGTTTINGTAVDTAGFEGVRFIVGLGTITATAVTTVKLQEDTTVGMGSAQDIAGSGLLPVAGGAGDNLLYILDIYRPRKRFVRVVIVRTVANAVIDLGIAEQYEGQFFPYAASASIGLQKILSSPAEGTP